MSQQPVNISCFVIDATVRIVLEKNIPYEAPERVKSRKPKRSLRVRPEGSEAGVAHKSELPDEPLEGGLEGCTPVRGRLDSIFL